MARRSTKSKSSRKTSRRSKSRSSRSKSKKSNSKPLWGQIHLTLDQQLDMIGGVLSAVALITFLSLVSSQRGFVTEMWISFLSRFFGWGRYAIPVFFAAVGLWLILRRFGDRISRPEPEQVLGVIMGFFVMLITFHQILAWIWPKVDVYALADAGKGGGMIGAALLDLGVHALGTAGMIAVLLMGWLVVITFTMGISPADAIRMLAGQPRSRPSRSMVQTTLPDFPPDADVAPAELPVDDAAQHEPARKSRRGRKNKAGDGPAINVATRPSNGEAEIYIPPPTPVGAQVWRLPSVQKILDSGLDQDYSEDLIRKQARIIEETLVSLGAPARVIEINRGPVVTQFGVEPLFLTSRSGKTTKVKVSKIANLADDLALALSAQSIRIEAPIPGKGLVGVEVPNIEPTVVALRDVMESKAFAKVKGRLRLGLGQDVSGHARVADLRTMPHMLIAGATGSGKSVCINAIIASFLLQNTPDTLRLMLVDPKRVELTQYNGIPHLLTPVITDVERVVPALKWVMREMDSRYRRFAQAGARHIEDFNRRAAKLEELTPIYYIAVIVDELADLMMQSPEETERVVCRLAQMARATGIHLIIATQRPSVDVVTGLIKANFPARVAFAVASSIDSRVILDTPGAERLLGQGDMLFMPPDVGQPVRLQGAHVADAELHKLISYWRGAVEPGQAPDQVVIIGGRNSYLRSGGNGDSTDDSLSQAPLFPNFEEDNVAEQFEDVLLPKAVEVLLAENRASISLLQRRLRIGYTRSARLVDLLTDMGIITNETRRAQSRGVNRAVAEALLASLQPEEEPDV